MQAAPKSAFGGEAAACGQFLVAVSVYVHTSNLDGFAESGLYVYEPSAHSPPRLASQSASFVENRLCWNWRVAAVPQGESFCLSKRVRGSLDQTVMLAAA